MNNVGGLNEKYIYTVLGTRNPIHIHTYHMEKPPYYYLLKQPVKMIWKLKWSGLLDQDSSEAAATSGPADCQAFQIYWEHLKF